MSKLFRFLLPGLLLSGCVFWSAPAAIPPAPPSPTFVPTATESPTATIVWFPPTETPTPFPSPVVTPTIDLRPTTGAILFQDEFPSAEFWQTSGTGRLSVASNRLTLALTEPRAYLSGVRLDLILADFYLEIEIETSLCRDFDQYGVLLRAASPSDFYRFGLSCNGQFRLDRVRGGTATSPVVWTFSSAVPPAAPAAFRLGVAAIGGRMLFFINDQFQLEAAAPLIPTGTVGVFARAAGESPVTVHFSNLIVWEIE